MNVQIEFPNAGGIPERRPFVAAGIPPIGATITILDGSRKGDWIVQAVAWLGEGETLFAVITVFQHGPPRARFL